MPAEKPMSRGEVYTVLIRVLNQKRAATKHEPTRRKLERVKWWLANDSAFLRDEREESHV